jgi:hypothetical protein
MESELRLLMKPKTITLIRSDLDGIGAELRGAMKVGERKESNPHIGTSVDGTVRAADFHGSSWAAGETTMFGTLDDGTAIGLYRLKNAKGSTAKVIT